MVRAEGLEPSRLATPDPKSGVSAISPRSRLILKYFLHTTQKKKLNQENNKNYCHI